MTRVQKPTQPTTSTRPPRQNNRPTVANARFRDGDNPVERQSSESRQTVANARFRGAEDSFQRGQRDEFRRTTGLSGQSESLANARFQGPVETSQRARRDDPRRNSRATGGAASRQTVANARFSGAGDASRAETVASARYGSYRSNDNPFRVTTPGEERPNTPPQPGGDNPPKAPPSDRPDNPGNNGFKYDARRNRMDERFEKAGIAANDPHGNYIKNVVLNAVSGIQQKVGYAVPRGSSEFGIHLLKALNGGAKTLASALGKFSFRDIMGGGLNQKPMFQHADKVGGEKFRDSVYNMGSSANRKDKDVTNIFLGAAGNDGGNINFKGEVNKVAKAFKDKLGAKIAGVMNNPSVKNIRDKFKKIHDMALKHKDKLFNVAFYYSGHGNWDHNGRKQGEATSYNQNFKEKELKQIQAMFKDTPNVSISNLIACCHAGGFIT